MPYNHFHKLYYLSSRSSYILFCFSKSLLLSWGVDGKVCLWDSYCRGQVGEPLCVLVSKPDYPIYAVDVVEGKLGQKSTIGVAGGTDGGFIGLPIFFYDY